MFLLRSCLQLSYNKKWASLIKAGKTPVMVACWLFNIPTLVFPDTYLPSYPLRTGELTSRLGSDSQVVQDMVTNNISMLARYTLQMLISIGFMFYVSAKLTAVLLSVVPIIAIAAVQYGKGGLE